MRAQGGEWDADRSRRRGSCWHALPLGLATTYKIIRRFEIFPSEFRHWSFDSCGVVDLLHPWEGMDSSLFTNALVYSPPMRSASVPMAGTGRQDIGLDGVLVSGSPVPSSEAALRALY